MQGTWPGSFLLASVQFCTFGCPLYHVCDDCICQEFMFAFAILSNNFHRDWHDLVQRSISRRLHSQKRPASKKRTPARKHFCASVCMLKFRSKPCRIWQPLPLSLLKTTCKGWVGTKKTSRDRNVPQWSPQLLIVMRMATTAKRKGVASAVATNFLIGLSPPPCFFSSFGESPASLNLFAVLCWSSRGYVFGYYRRFTDKEEAIIIRFINAHPGSIFLLLTWVHIRSRTHS